MCFSVVCYLLMISMLAVTQTYFPVSRESGEFDRCSRWGPSTELVEALRDIVNIRSPKRKLGRLITQYRDIFFPAFLVLACSFRARGRQQCRFLIQNFLEPARSLFDSLPLLSNLLEFIPRPQKRAKILVAGDMNEPKWKVVVASSLSSTAIFS